MCNEPLRRPLPVVAVLWAGLILVSSLQNASAQESDPRREPITAVKEAIRLLESKEYVLFLKTFVRPAELEEQLAKHQTMEAVAAEFTREERPAKLLEVLKAASTLTPTMNAAGTRADFKFEKPVGGANRLSLAKIGDYWFIRD